MAEVSLGRSVALAALAPIATREADRRERLEKEAREQEEAAERARRREVELKAALDEVPELPRPTRPDEPFRERFDSERFLKTLYLTPVFLILMTTLPWLPMLIAPIGLALLNGFWPVLRVMPARERFRAALQEHEAAIAAADRRDAERAEIRKSFGGEELSSPEPR